MVQAQALVSLLEAAARLEPECGKRSVVPRRAGRQLAVGRLLARQVEETRRVAVPNWLAEVDCAVARLELAWGVVLWRGCDGGALVSVVAGAAQLVLRQALLGRWAARALSLAAEPRASWAVAHEDGPAVWQGSGLSTDER